MPGPGRLRAAAAFVPVALLALLLRAPIADLPLERDEGEYAYIAQRWLAGEVPYRDAFDQKPPGAFAVYALILAGLGPSVAAIHWGAQLWTLGTLALVFVLGRRLHSPAAGWVAAALAAFHTADVAVFGNAANTETFMILPLTGAAAQLFKQVALPNVVLCALLLAGAGPRRRGAHLALYAAGGAALALPVLGYFLAVGAWGEFADCVVRHNVAYAARVPPSLYPRFLGEALARILRTSWPIWALAAWGLAAALAISRRQGWRRDPGRLLAWAAASACGVAVGGFFRPHYFIQAVPALALLAGLGAADLARRCARWLPGALVAAALLVGLVATPWYWRPGDPVGKCRRIYGSNPFAESSTVGRFIAENTTPDERVLIFGSEPQMLFHAARRSASRYIFMYPLTAALPDARARQLELLDELARDPPRLVVSIMEPTSFQASAGTPADLFAGVAGLLDREYHVVAVAPLIGKLHEVEWLTGDAARAAWGTRAPRTSATPFWCQLSVWERNDARPATAPRPDAG
jgi:hypothetical protein